MSLESQLVTAQAALENARKYKSIQHGDDRKEMQSIADLKADVADLETRISRASRGPRVSGIRIRHGS